MKPRTIILLLAVVASASFLFGAKVAAKNLKWPYALAKWSEPAKITKLELACLKSEFRSAKIAKEPIAVECNNRKRETVILIDRITIKPSKRFLKINADARPFSKKTKLMRHDLQQACVATKQYFFSAQSGKAKDLSLCPYAITIKIKGKVVARRSVDGKIKTRFD